MASSGVTMARMYSFTIPPSWGTATAHCRKGTWSNSKLCKDQKVRKQPTCKNRAAKLSALPLFPAGKDVPLCRPFVLPSRRPLICIALTLGLFPVSLAQTYNRHMDNKTIARILRDTAQLLEIDGAIIGRYRSYEKAAELISGMHESIEELAKD